MKNIRLKCIIDEKQLKDRLSYNPEIIELQLVEEDIYNIDKIYNAIHMLKEKGVKPFLHQPMKLKSDYLDILSDNKAIRDFFLYSSQVISEICQKEDVYCVIHAHYADSESSYKTLNKENSLLMRNEIEKITEFETKYFLWENTTEGLFSHENSFLFSEIVESLNLPLTFDVSHSFISLKGNNDGLLTKLKEFNDYIQYFHIVDSLGLEHDSLILGKGGVNWSNVKPFTEGRNFIFEIGLTDFNDCTPMIQSVEYYNNLNIVRS